MARIKKRDLQRIVQMCEEQGCVVTQGQAKLRIKCPSGAVVSLHQTPTDQTAWVNMTRQALTRAGLTWTLDMGKGSPKASERTGRSDEERNNA